MIEGYCTLAYIDPGTPPVGYIQEAVFTALEPASARYFKCPAGWGINQEILNRHDVQRVAITAPNGRIIAEAEAFNGSGIPEVEVNGVTYKVLAVEAWQYERKVPKIK